MSYVAAGVKTILVKLMLWGFTILIFLSVYWMVTGQSRPLCNAGDPYDHICGP